jgi:hypothetical protein
MTLRAVTTLLGAILPDEQPHNGGRYINSTDHPRKPGGEKLNLQVRDGNASAESFYESPGFILGFIKKPRSSMGKLVV